MRLLALILFSFVSLSLAVEFKAIAVLTPTNVNEPISGTVKFTYEDSTKTMTVDINVTGISSNPDGNHGIHIHEFGDLRGFLPGAGSSVLGDLSVGSHFNPLGANHACETSTTPGHAGDMGNWLATGGSIISSKTFTGAFSLISGDATSIVGRAVVLHRDEDDCATVASSGPRLAIGLVGVADSVGKGGSSGSVTEAVCVLQGTTFCKGPTCPVFQSGQFLFSDSSNGIQVSGRVNGLNTPPSTQERAMHIHDFGDLSSGDGASVGSHWNPNGKSHGLPPSDDRHGGDLGTIHVFDSTGNGFYSYTSYFTSWTLKVSDIIGHSLVVHADIDHGLEDSCKNVSGYATGAAGSRLFWCVIGVQNSADQAVPENALPLPDTADKIFRNTWSNVPCGTCCVSHFSLSCNNDSYTNGDFCVSGSTCCLISDGIGVGANSYSCCSSSQICVPSPNGGFIPNICADKANPCGGVSCPSGSCYVDSNGYPKCPAEGSCPDGTQPVKCACGECPAFPDAVCTQDNCNSCKTSWTVDGKPVDCDGTCCVTKWGNCTTDSLTNGDYCSAGSTCCLISDGLGVGVHSFSCCDKSKACVPNPVPGFIPNICVDPNTPCAGVTCPNGGICTSKDGAPMCTQQAAVVCPDDLPLANCSIPPCSASRCPGFPDASCESNYCGGCSAIWRLDGKPVDCSGRCCVSRIANCTLQSVDNGDYCPAGSTCCLTSDAIGVGAKSYTCCDSSRDCLPNPVSSFSPYVCAPRDDPCSVINCGIASKCTVESGKPKCVPLTQDICNNCDGLVYPASVLLCPDGKTYTSYKCNTTSCSYDFQPCPEDTCSDCTVTGSTCPTSTAANPCGTKVCKKLYGSCVGSWSCDDCPSPPPACEVTGCFNEMCAAVGTTNYHACAPTNQSTTTLPCSRYSVCEYNSYTSSCQWRNTSSYVTCLTTPKYEDCKLLTACQCVANSHCGWCQQKYALPYGGSFTLSKCMNRGIAGDICRPGNFIGYLTCPAGLATPSGQTTLQTKLATVSQTDVQYKLNNIMAQDDVVGYQYSMLLETILQIGASPTDASKTVVLAETLITGITDPTAVELQQLCMNLGLAIAQSAVSNGRVSTCTLTKLNGTVSDPIQKRFIQDAHASSVAQTYVAEATLYEAPPPSNQVAGWVIACIVVAILFVIILVLVVAYFVLIPVTTDGAYKKH